MCINRKHSMKYLQKVIQCIKKCHFMYCYRKISNNILSEQNKLLKSM